MSEAACLMCGEKVVESLQASHLAERHPPTEGFGYRLHIDAILYYSPVPSMTILELKHLYKCEPTYSTMVEYEPNSEPHYLSDGNAIDLTNDPWVYFVPPATF